MGEEFAELHLLMTNYELYKDKRIVKRRFKHQELTSIIEDLKSSKIFHVKEAGRSVEDRPIFIISAGKGKIRVLLWSQMHGDESTATMALLDLFQFLKQDDKYNNIRRLLFEKLTIHFIPVLNPDGLESFTRSNALKIDINRDAKALTSPEAQILSKAVAEIKPHFGFNLHDKNHRYSVGNTAKPATISLLAPPYDYEKSENVVRENAMKVTSMITAFLQNYIPEQIGKWPDDYEPRAFGDYIQSVGTSTILIESGGYYNDPEKQFIRKLNFAAILLALKVIAEDNYYLNDMSIYKTLPVNTRHLFDFLIRNARISKNNKTYKADIGINRYEITSEREYYYKGIVEEIGDLHYHGGFEELDAGGFLISEGLMYEEANQIQGEEVTAAFKLVKKGFTYLRTFTENNNLPYTSLPINLVKPNSRISPALNIDTAANFVLKDRDDIKYIIVNGFLVIPNSNIFSVPNCLKF